MTKSDRFQIIFPSSLSDSKILYRQEVNVDYNDSYSRKVLPGVEEHLKKAWRRALKRSSFDGFIQPFNKSKFRLEGFFENKDGLTLKLGPTLYKEYIAFRTDPILFQKVKELGEQAYQYLPNIIGNAAIILTGDRKSLAVIRSDKVSTYKGYLDLPGGHPEPTAAIHESSGKFSSEIIRDELFNSILREIQEEICIDQIHLEDPLLLSILMNLEDILKPDMIFFVKTRKLSETIIQDFLEQEQNLMEVDKVVRFDPFSGTEKLFKYKMTPVMECGLLLLKKLRFIL